MTNQNSIVYDLSSKSKKEVIMLVYLEKSFSQNYEYYELNINQNGILIASPTNRGIVLGIQTLLQLIEKYKKDLKLPYLKIKDEL